jgi:hypothetical protein
MLTHTRWTQEVPFDEYGDHINVKRAFSNRMHQRGNVEGGTTRKGGSGEAASEALIATGVDRAAAARVGDPVPVRQLPAILANIGLVTYRNGAPVSTVKPAPPERKQKQAFYCGLCDRKLLRMDQYGELVPLDMDTDGKPVPLTCPGCKQVHSDWVVR